MMNIQEYKDISNLINTIPLTRQEADLLFLYEEQLNTSVAKYVTYLRSEKAKIHFLETASANQEALGAIREELLALADETSLSAEGIVEQIYTAGEGKGYSDIRQVAVFTPQSAEALKFLQTYQYDLVRQASEDFISMLHGEIFTGMAQGLHPYQIASNLLNSKFEIPEGWNITPMQRARMIARTETARAWTTGTMQAYENYGVSEIDVITAGDASVCEICLENEAQNPHQLSEATELVPAHPNCRCTISAHIRQGTQLKVNEDAEVINLIPS